MYTPKQCMLCYHVISFTYLVTYLKTLFESITFVGIPYVHTHYNGKIPVKMFIAGNHKETLIDYSLLDVVMNGAFYKALHGECHMEVSTHPCNIHHVMPCRIYTIIIFILFCP